MRAPARDKYIHDIQDNRQAHMFRIEPVKDEACMTFIVDRPTLDSETDGLLDELRI